MKMYSFSCYFMSVFLLLNANNPVFLSIYNKKMFFFFLDPTDFHAWKKTKQKHWKKVESRTLHHCWYLPIIPILSCDHVYLYLNIKTLQFRKHVMHFLIFMMIWIWMVSKFCCTCNNTQKPTEIHPIHLLYLKYQLTKSVKSIDSLII